MIVIEQNIYPKISEEECEDAISISSDFIAVIDGATDKSGWKSDTGKAGGQVAADILKDAIKHLPTEITARAAIDFLTDQLNSEWERQEKLGFQIPKDSPIWASITIYSRFHNEIWQVGDVGFRTLQGIDDAFSISEGEEDKIVERFYSSIRSEFIKSLLNTGMTTEEAQIRNERVSDPHWQVIRMETVFVNNPESEFGFGVITGYHVPETFINVYPIPEGIEEIIFASDGYPLLGTTLASTHNYLMGALERDPLCIGEIKGAKGLKPGNRSFDDATYIRFSI
jgi:hypothetical protein